MLSSPLQFSVQMAEENDNGDSPLSMTASIAGILTLAIALIGATWLWVKLALKAREELRIVERTRQWHSKETTWLDNSVFAANERGPQHISKLATSKIKKIQTSLELMDHLRTLDEQKQKAIDMTKALSEELQSLDGKLPPILLRATTSHSATERRRHRASEAARAMTTGGPHEVAPLSEIIFEGMTDAAAKVSAAQRLLWLPFRSDALDTIKQMSEMRNRLLFVQLAMLDMRMVDTEMRMVTHEKLLLEIWEMLREVRDAQNGGTETLTPSTRSDVNGHG